MSEETTDKYTVVIGLEVHAQLLTESKIYNADAAQFGNSPNTNVSPITLGHPGTLPRLNKKVVEYAIRMGLACESEISRYNIFDRKNYFYPDLPKGYQITQDRTPLCVGGKVTISPKESEDREIRLNRIHIEEDAGKSIHMAGEVDTLVDFNRSGVPLIEIVTEPDLRSPEEAHAFLSEVRRLVRYLGICDGNMEEGSLRCDANISIMPRDADAYGKKVEVKNMNSLRNVQRAITHEISRQVELAERGEPIISETRTFDAASGTTAGMRTKEELNDYRYFPDPDLSPLEVSEEWLDDIRRTLPELPRQLARKYKEVYGLPEYDAEVLTDNQEIARYFDELVKLNDHYKSASNWVMGPVKSFLNESSVQIEDFPIRPDKLAALIDLVESGKVSFTVASQRLFQEMLENTSIGPEALAKELNLIQENDDDAIEALVDEVIRAFPEKVTDYKNGHKGLLGMFMGELMKRGNGKINPKIANELLRKKLG